MSTNESNSKPTRARLSRRHLILVAAGAPLVAANEASAVPDHVKKRISEAAKTIRTRCENTCNLIGEKKVWQLLGRNSQSFHKILSDGIGDVAVAHRPAVQAVIDALQEMKDETGNHVYFRDLLTRHPSDWGRGHEANIIDKMEAGLASFIEPQLAHIKGPVGETPDQARIRWAKTEQILYGWRSGDQSDDPWVSGFVQLCGNKNVVDVFTVEQSGAGAKWIDQHLYPWLTGRCFGNLLFPERVLHNRAVETSAPTDTTMDDHCTAYNSNDGYYCVPHEGKTCKLDNNGEPKKGTDYCDPPGGP